MSKLLVFRPSLGDGGADRVTLTLLEHLDRARFRPVLVLLRRTGVLAGDIPADVPVIELGARRLLLAVPALARAIRAERPDVVLSTASGANPIAAAAHRLARSRARLVLSERTAVRRRRTPGRAPLELRLKRWAYRRADVVTAVSDGVAADLVAELGLPADRVRVVYNPLIGPDLADRAAEAVAHPYFGDGGRTLVAVGRLAGVKDYPTMLAALGQVRRRHAARLAVLGIGPEREQLERRARSLGLADHVAFLGFDPNPYRYMARADVVVQTSRAEGLPGTIIQAMACGTPVVATDCDHGPREVIHDGVDGFLAPVGDAAAVADRIAQLLGDPALRRAMGDAARGAVARFGLAASLARYEAVLDG